MKHFTSDIVIGLEIHVECNTKTKLFCSCPTHGNEEPNTRTCPICLGHPGSKPVLNKKAVEFALKLCLALNCEVSPELIFSRKSYFYPDMAKNYQITQYDVPLGKSGKLRLSSGKEIGITRVHMEEDPASLVHPAGLKESQYVLVDYNRSGNPLVEIVTEPDLTSPDEAKDFMKQLITVLSYLEIFDINNGIIKADANVSVKESGYKRVEIKNITGFKEIEMALLYEVKRQREEAHKIEQETRSWDSERGITFTLRKKETEEDYGYIIDTDLVVTEIEDKWVNGIRKHMPELAQDKVRKFIDKYKIKKEDAEILASDRQLAEIFERVSKEINPLLAAKWLRRELLRVLNYSKKELHEVEIEAKHMIDLLKLVEGKKITDNVASKILEKLVEKAFDIGEFVKKEGLEAVSDVSELEKYSKQSIKGNPQAVKDYENGNENALNFIVGNVMNITKGKASPQEVNNLIKFEIDAKNAISKYFNIEFDFDYSNSNYRFDLVSKNRDFLVELKYLTDNSINNINTVLVNTIQQLAHYPIKNKIIVIGGKFSFYDPEIRNSIQKISTNLNFKKIKLYFFDIMNKKIVPLDKNDFIR